MGEGDKAEWAAQECIARGQIGTTLQKQIEQRQIKLKHVRSRSPNGPRHRSASAPRDVFRRRCWSIHSRTNGIKRDELIEMAINLMTHHGGAKKWPTTADIFDGESQTVMEYIRAKGYSGSTFRVGAKKPSWKEVRGN